MAHKTNHYEIDSINTHALLSWRAIVAGILVAMFTMMGLVGLGLAFGGIGMDQTFSFQAAGIYTGIWFLVSTLVSLFAGSYFAARVSKFRTGVVGSAQGLVIAALFLGFFLYQSFNTIGAIGSATGNIIGSAGGAIGNGVSQVANNQQVANAVGTYAEDTLSGLNLQSSPQVVAQGLMSRMLNGNIEGAKSYLASQSGISVTEAETRINQLQTRVDQLMNQVQQAAATTLKSLGWSLFLLVTLGALAGMGGGALGSSRNFKNPLIREERGTYPDGHRI